MITSSTVPTIVATEDDDLEELLEEAENFPVEQDEDGNVHWARLSNIIMLNRILAFDPYLPDPYDPDAVPSDEEETDRPDEEQISATIADEDAGNLIEELGLDDLEPVSDEELTEEATR
ncbi:hypothetical protein ABN584_27480 [Gloeocapsa sp. BRSZ]